MKNERTCPHCGVSNKTSGHVSGSDRQPKPGDVCVCASCTGISIHTEHDPVFPTPAKAQEIARDPILMMTIAATSLSLAVHKGQKKIQEN